MPAAPSPAALNGSAPARPPAPVSLPLRALLPARPLAAGLTVAGISAVAVTVVRPKNLPPQVQRAADALTGVTVGLHPFEALYLRRRVSRHNVTPGTVRKSMLSTLVFGIFGAIPALRAVRRATR